jgi:hypothetical protein
MGDQGFLPGQYQFEIITQKLFQALFDLLGFGFGSGEPEEMIVGIPDAFQPPA